MGFLLPFLVIWLVASCLMIGWWLKVISYLRHILSLWGLSGNKNPTMLQTIFYREGGSWVQKPNFVNIIGLTSLFLTLFYAGEATLRSFCTRRLKCESVSFLIITLPCTSKRLKKSSSLFAAIGLCVIKPFIRHALYESNLHPSI